MIDEIGEYNRIRGMLMTLQPCKVKGVPIQEKSYWISIHYWWCWIWKPWW